MQEKSILLFDFFGVICSEVSPLWLERYFTPQQAMKIKNDIVGKADLGDISEAEMLTQLATVTGTDSDKVLTDWLELAQINECLLHAIIQLKINHRLALLSNAPGEFLHRLLKQHDLYKYFEVIVISSEVHMSKPDKCIYDLIVDRLGVVPGECILIDDNPVNLVGAASAGIDGYLYTDVASFLQIFKN